MKLAWTPSLAGPELSCASRALVTSALCASLVAGPPQPLYAAAPTSLDAGAATIDVRSEDARLVRILRVLRVLRTFGMTAELQARPIAQQTLTVGLTIVSVVFISSCVFPLIEAEPEATTAAASSLATSSNDVPGATAKSFSFPHSDNA